MQLWEYLAAAAAALVGGMMNSLVGGGTLVTFPMLVALGVPPVAANMTNTVALCPGYLGGTYAQRRALAGQRPRLSKLLIAGAVGGIAGAALLRVTSDDSLRLAIPVLLGVATLLLALQPRLRGWLGRHAATASRPDAVWLVPVVAVIAVYGGFFGAGIGVMLLAVLGLGVHEPLTRANALKQILSLTINVVAAAFFVFSGKVWWTVAAVMGVGSWLGGAAGGRMVGRLDPERFRVVVVVIGTAISLVYGVRVYG
jgi:uncharacterized membrane protein YfcA